MAIQWVTAIAIASSVSSNFGREVFKNIIADTMLPITNPDMTALEFLSFCLLILAPFENIFLSIEQINWIGYINVNILLENV